MSLIWVCANDSGCRRLYVDNLVLRGYVAVGTASVAEARRLLERETPHIILACCLLDEQDEVVKNVRAYPQLDEVPIVLVSPDMPEREWMQRWGVATCLPYPTDLRKLVQLLQPWLAPTETASLYSQTTPHMKLKDAAL